MPDPVTPPPVLRPRLSELVELAEEGRRLIERATPAPWQPVNTGDHEVTITGEDATERVARVDYRYDARPIVWLRNNADALLSVTALCGALAAAVKDIGGAPHGRLCPAGSPGPHDTKPYRCDCWKAAALAHINQLVDTEGSGDAS